MSTIFVRVLRMTGVALLALVARLDAYTNNIMVTGYWPPTNEMLRPFSDDPIKNPQGWQGLDWEGRGYNIYAYFPEFNNYPVDQVGTGDFQVDYQDTSADWARITDLVKPVAIITFSQTSQYRYGWELELRQRNLATWVDDFVAPFQPTPAPPDSSVPAGYIRNSSLPVDAIADAVRDAQLGVVPRIDTTSFGGGFLSEFMAYHGTWYHDTHMDPMDPFRNVAAGHIHVGNLLSVSQSRAATEISLRELIRHVDLVLGIPEPSLGSSLLLVAWGIGLARRRGQ